MSYVSLPFGLVNKEKKLKFDLPKTYTASQYIKHLPYIDNEDPNFQNKIINLVNNRSDLQKFLHAASDYGDHIQEKISLVVGDEGLNHAMVRRA